MKTASARQYKAEFGWANVQPIVLLSVNFSVHSIYSVGIWLVTYNGISWHIYVFNKNNHTSARRVSNRSSLAIRTASSWHFINRKQDPLKQTTVLPQYTQQFSS